MKAFLKTLVNLVLIASLISALTHCVKKDFDEPPMQQIPVGTILTIGDLYDIYADSGQYRFTRDYSLYATVTMDESSGNIYRSSFIQDSSGAINLRLRNPGGLRVGDMIRVYLKNCIISDYENLLQIDNVDNDSSIIINATGKYLNPETVTINQIKSGNYLSKLIRLENVEFANAELGKTWAETSDYANRTLTDCNGNTIIVRTSDYANFAEDVLPQGNGSLVAIAAVYREDWQLYVRTITEVSMNGPRCDSTGGGLEQISIAEVRALYSGSSVILPEGKKIVGVITSDKNNENLPGQNAFIQEAGGSGIALRFTEWHDLPMGALVEIDISGQELSAYKGLVQINNLPLSNAVATGTGQMPAPAELTIAQLNSAYDEYQGELVKISNVLISNSSGYTTYKYTTILNDGTGQIDMFTYDWASFANEPFPTETVTITGIASYYDGPQISIRNLDDVVIGGGGGSSSVFNIDFQNQVNYEDITISGWVNQALEGTRVWIAREFSGDIYAQATSYNSGEYEVMWLITQPIDLTTLNQPKMEFETAKAYWDHSGLSVLISNDFDGMNIENATWTPLSATLAGENDPDHEWIPSGVIDLSVFSGTVWVGFRYEGDDNASQNTTFRVDDVKVYENSK